LNNALISASEAVLPTIVSISVVSEVPRNQFGGRGNDFFDFFEPFFRDRDRNREEDKPDLRQGGGSGVIISKDGYIVTNCHVVENATEDGITVTTSNRKQYSAKLVGIDSLTDLAVIKIQADEDFNIAHFGSADSLRLGQIVIAVGNPMGLNHTVTQGIISALGRDQFASIRRSSYSIENYIQTDAAINPGNSGGGLFNINGSLIGINTLIATTSGGFQGYGFAIPIDIVESTVRDLITSGRVNRGYIGCAVLNLDDKFAKHLGLDKVEGVLIQDVMKDSPAEKAGIQPEDVILKVNDRNITALADFRSALSAYRVGEEITLTL
jgi:serine protease Do